MFARMPNKTLYVGPRQMDVWSRAEAFAAVECMSVSSLVVRALREYLDRAITVVPAGTDGTDGADGAAEDASAGHPRCRAGDLEQRVAALERAVATGGNQQESG